MPYITVLQFDNSASSIDELSDKNIIYVSHKYSRVSMSRKTYYIDQIPDFIKTNSVVNYSTMINSLVAFQDKYSNLFMCDRNSLYNSFVIPKRNGGLRQINAPKNNLMVALNELKSIFENVFHTLPHQSAYAYIDNCNILDCIKCHQVNNSKWFAKFDFSNFFNSTTSEFVIDMLKQIYPFSELMNTSDDWNYIIRESLDICFLNNTLPQGSPISPIISNIMMVPIDYHIDKYLRENYANNHFVYTRYADDIIISSPDRFDYLKIQDCIINILNQFNTPFALNNKKTKYNSSSGSNWNLGLVLNKDNNITIGYKNKKTFKSRLNHYIWDRKNNINWSDHDINVLSGLISYYKMIEKDYIDYIIKHYNTKYNIDIIDMIHGDLRNIQKR